MVRAVRPRELPAMPAKGLQTPVVPFDVRLPDRMVPRERELGEQLRTAQTRPPRRRVVQGGGELVGLGDQVAGSGRWHGPKCITTER